MEDCVFCKIAAGELDAEEYYRDDAVVVFADRSPQAPVHALVIPVKHVASVEELADADGELMTRLIFAARKVARELGCAKSGYRLVTNAGPESGQLVYHLHFHLLGGRPLAPQLG
jgi:histidine triad (HIT) family protein